MDIFDVLIIGLRDIISQQNLHKFSFVENDTTVGYIKSSERSFTSHKKRLRYLKTLGFFS